jgi:hypothetical protein
MRSSILNFLMAIKQQTGKLWIEERLWSIDTFLKLKELTALDLSWISKVHDNLGFLICFKYIPIIDEMLRSE